MLREFFTVSRSPQFASQGGGQPCVKTRMYRFTAGDDGLLLGEAVIPLAQRGRTAPGQLKVKLGPHIDITKYAFPCGPRLCIALPCGCCMHRGGMAALGAKGLCRNCPKITEEVMKVIINHCNTSVQEWSRTGTPGEESDEEFAGFNKNDAQVSLD
ncbi:uncharacterized protein EV422DRAFT_385310 [Fimicolochytrium jonesii]|uniref:uncharacterized protein n=1 Tax=Fimicolochytrium jonesii TaxID=1396493 RepID=UPI0022FE4710|nr:uncharacterized protein EV422DRAFT_385310 [Fimicolochytrium jonesii]KAI8822942.1 hypothetical protein EV422DRAFT_385310 [Fimicolochytrium jonesii]